MDEVIDSNSEMIATPREMTIRKRLERKQENAQEKLNNINNALQILNDNPKVAEVLEALSKLNVRL